MFQLTQNPESGEFYFGIDIHPGVASEAIAHHPLVAADTVHL